MIGDLEYNFDTSDVITYKFQDGPIGFIYVDPASNEATFFEVIEQLYSDIPEVISLYRISRIVNYHGSKLQSELIEDIISASKISDKHRKHMKIVAIGVENKGFFPLSIRCLSVSHQSQSAGYEIERLDGFHKE
jgi:hypothetical protein